MFGFFTRKLMLVVMLALAVGVPYVIHSDGVKGLLDLLSISLPSGKSDRFNRDLELAKLLGDDEVSGEASALAPVETRGAMITGPEVQHLQAVFRFDILPDWVMQSWSRVTVVPQGNLRGLRVPLVSGLQLHDVAGSLTYCFDEKNRLQRITFRGSTGNPEMIETVAARGFGLKNEGGSHGGLHVARWNGEPTSYLLIENAPTVRADSPHTRFSVRMELNRPRAYLQVSPELKQVVMAELDQDATWRW